MGGEGSMMHTIITLRNNRAMRRNRKTLREMNEGHAVRNNVKLLRKRGTLTSQQQEQVKQLKKRVKLRKQREQWILWTILTISFSLMIFFLLRFVLKYL